MRIGAPPPSRKRVRSKPPTRKSRVNSSTAKPGPSANQRRLVPGSANAAKTRAGGRRRARAAPGRPARRGGCGARPVPPSAPPVLARLVLLGQGVAQPVEPALPERAALGQPCRRAADLPGADQPAASSTCRCWTTAASVMPNGRPGSETDIGPWLSRATSARRVGSPRAAKTRSAAPGATPLAVRPHTEREVRDASGVDQPDPLQRHASGVEPPEQRRAAAEQDVDGVEPQLVQETGREALLDDGRPARHRQYLPRPGCRHRLPAARQTAGPRRDAPLSWNWLISRPLRGSRVTRRIGDRRQRSPARVGRRQAGGENVPPAALELDPLPAGDRADDLSAQLVTDLFTDRFTKLITWPPAVMSRDRPRPRPPLHRQMERGQGGEDRPVGRASAGGRPPVPGRAGQSHSPVR